MTWGAESDPEPARCMPVPRKRCLGCPARGCCSPWELWGVGRKPGALAEMVREVGGSHLPGGSAPQLQTHCRNETNYSSLQLESLREKAFTKG